MMIDCLIADAVSWTHCLFESQKLLLNLNLFISVRTVFLSPLTLFCMTTYNYIVTNVVRT